MSEPLDRETIATLFEMGCGDAEWIEDLLRLYVSDTEERIQQARALVQAGDATALRALAHTLKGTSANVGARRMQSLSSALETMAKNGDLSIAVEQVAAIAEEFGKVKADIPAVMSTLAVA